MRSRDDHSPARVSWARRAVITLVSVGLSLLLGTLAGTALVNAGAGSEDETEPSPAAPTPDEVEPAAIPSDTVERYLQALADADAGAALAEAAQLPADTSLLTDDALAAGEQISDVTVPETLEGDSVEASYLVGEERVTTRIGVLQIPNGYQVSEVTSQVDVGSLRSDGLALLVAGTPVSGSTLTLFPGLYPVTSDSDAVAYGEGQLAVLQPGTASSTEGLDPVLTEAGADTVEDGVAEAVATCLDTDVPQPEGCPFVASVPGEQQLVDGSGSWELLTPVGDLNPELVPGQPALASADLALELVYRYRWTDPDPDDEGGPLGPGEQDGEVPVSWSGPVTVDLGTDPPTVQLG